MNPVRGLAALALAATLAACAHGGPAYNAAPAGVKVVTMTSGLHFEPMTLTIQRGQTVQWANKAFMSHTVTFDPAKAKTASDVSLPAGVAPFDSGSIKPGQVYSHTFTTAGAYHYVCKPHEGNGMKGVIVVQ
jgi:plastocyanin